MKKAITNVPNNGKDFLDLLINMKDQTKSSWMYVHVDLVTMLKEACDEFKLSEDIITLTWYANDIYCRNEIMISLTDFTSAWKPIVKIDSIYIPFDRPAIDPENILFFK